MCQHIQNKYLQHVYCIIQFHMICLHTFSVKLLFGPCENKKLWFWMRVETLRCTQIYFFCDMALPKICKPWKIFHLYFGGYFGIYFTTFSRQGTYPHTNAELKYWLRYIFRHIYFDIMTVFHHWRLVGTLSWSYTQELDKCIDPPDK